MNIETLKRTVIVPTSDFYRQSYPNGHTFKRLTLTLSKKGWSASVQWDGTLGARGDGATQEEAIANAVEFARNEWKRDVVEVYNQ